MNLIKNICNPLRLKNSCMFLKKIDIHKSRINISSKGKLYGKITSNFSEISIESGFFINASLYAENNSIIQIGKNVVIGDDSIINAENSAIKIEENTSIHSNIYISGNVKIGCKCLIAQDVILISGFHLIHSKDYIRNLDAEYQKKNNKTPDKPIYIGDECWIGARAILLPGVTLGKGCVVGAGAVVTKSFDEFSVVGGVPARLIKKRG